MTNPKPYNDEQLVICDSCGAQRYRSECDFTWDGYLMCHTRGCWTQKDWIFEIPPVINDPFPIQDVRPDQRAGTERFADNTVGMITTFSTVHQKFNEIKKTFGNYNSPPNYIGN